MWPGTKNFLCICFQYRSHDACKGLYNFWSLQGVKPSQTSTLSQRFSYVYFHASLLAVVNICRTLASSGFETWLGVGYIVSENFLCILPCRSPWACEHLCNFCRFRVRDTSRRQPGHQEVWHQTFRSWLWGHEWNLLEVWNGQWITWTSWLVTN